MFARPPAAALASAPPADARPFAPAAILKRAAANPFALVGGAAALCVLSVAALIVVAGDPHAGAPSVRVKLANAPALPAGALRSALTPQDAAPDAQAAADALAAGQAVITLPQGAHVTDVPGASGPAAIDAPIAPASPPLPKAPFAGLTAPGPGGLLPVIGKDGKTPFAAYARPFTPNGKPRIALVIGGLGLNASATKAAIERLPAEVTLSFVPYADGLQGWIDQARAHGHEAVLDIPMEPLDYPNNDPGPYTLMASAPQAETTRRLEWLLSRATGYFAVTNYLGGKFLTSGEAVGGFVGALKARGLGFVDDGSARGKGAGTPRGSADAVIDQDLSSATIDRQLTALEGQALGRGQALGAGFAYPVTVETVSRWAAGLAGRGYQLAPASALMRK